MSDLSPSMQLRLEKFRESQLKPKESTPKKKSPGNYVPTQGDYGDDIRDYERKDEAAWAQELANNPIYRGYR